ncbi:MAG: IPT/TIG domain-containing protein [Deltaproteobacteria bacterium]|nr:IPT/TIG domain-containing protein [Deltaproteobacteria bacterium]
MAIRTSAATAASLLALLAACGGGDPAMPAANPPPPSTSPQVQGISPGAGPTAGGTTVTIAGSGFVTGSTVTFGGVAAPVAGPATATSLSVVAPAHAAGPVDVRVVNPDGQASTSASPYTYLSPAPQILALNVRGGPPAGGTQVLAVGSGFEPGVTVAVGGLAATGATIVALGPGSLAVSFFTPPHAEGFAEVVITNPDGQGASYSSFHYGPPPAVDAVACSAGCGSVRRDDLVTFTGSGFTTAAGEGVQVLFSSVDRPQKAVAVLVSASPTELVVQAPRLDPGLYSLVVSNFDGQYDVAAAQLTYPAP